MKTIIDRLTSAGQLTIAIRDDGALRATFAGKDLNTYMAALPAPVAGPLGLVTHAMGTHPRVGLYGTEVALIEAAQALFVERRRIVTRAADGVGAFPGSRAARDAQQAERELAAFDAAHPEVVEGIRAAHRAEMADSPIGRHAE